MEEWIKLIQGTAFPIVGCCALGAFIHITLKDHRALYAEMTKANNDALREVRVTEAAARLADREAATSILQHLDAAVKENTSATYELAKAIGELSVRISIK